MAKTVKFDPGMGEFVLNFNEFVNDVYSQLMSFRTIHQKRARFKLYTAKIERYMKNNIAFYLGCLLWAYYIVNENKNDPKELVGNVFLNMSEEEKAEYDYMIQVNFMENYFECFERDVLYYTGKKVAIPEQWKKILSLYSEFLTLNNGFVATKTTNDIVLPEMLKNMKTDKDVSKLIDNAISTKSLEVLLDTEILA